jgi:hypothetical protein
MCNTILGGVFPWEIAPSRIVANYVFKVGIEVILKRGWYTVRTLQQMGDVCALTDLVNCGKIGSQLRPQIVSPDISSAVVSIARLY